MRATNFQYDGAYLSDFGFTICDIDGKAGVTTESGSSIITFTKVPHYNGRHFSLSGSQTDECVTATFSICKDPCRYHDNLDISDVEYRQIARWLNRRSFFPFRFVDDSGTDTIDDCYYNASFNLEQVFFGGSLIGINLTMETDSPFGRGDEIVYTSTGSSGENWEMYVDLESDDIGYVYPTIIVECEADGSVRIENATNGTATEITGCEAGEVITIDGASMQVYSSLESHDIADDFSYTFVALESSLNNTQNELVVSAPCKLTVKYTPAIKLVM